MQYKVVIGIQKKLGKITLTYKNVDLLTFWYTGGSLNGDGTDLIILKNLFRVTNKSEAQNYFLLDKVALKEYEIEIRFNPYEIKHLEKLYLIKKTGL